MRARLRSSLRYPTSTTNPAVTSHLTDILLNPTQAFATVDNPVYSSTADDRPVAAAQLPVAALEGPAVHGTYEFLGLASVVGVQLAAIPGMLKFVAAFTAAPWVLISTPDCCDSLDYLIPHCLSVQPIHN